MTTGFNTEYTEGTNLDVLKKAKRWFKKYEDKAIVRYKFTIDKKEELKANIDEKSLKQCHICNQRLYELDEDSQYDNRSKNSLVIAQKRHMIFISDQGNEFCTCYKLKHCFRRSGKTIGVTTNCSGCYTKEELKNVSFSDIMKVDQYENAFVKAADEDFEKDIKPILEKWTFIDINKSNMFNFIKDYYSILSYARKYLDVEKKRSKFVNKLLEIMGIENEA